MYGFDANPWRGRSVTGAGGEGGREPTASAPVNTMPPTRATNPSTTSVACCMTDRPEPVRSTWAKRPVTRRGQDADAAAVLLDRVDSVGRAGVVDHDDRRAGSRDGVPLLGAVRRHVPEQDRLAAFAPSTRTVLLAEAIGQRQNQRVLPARVLVAALHDLVR